MTKFVGAIDHDAERALIADLTTDEPRALLETFSGLVRESGSEEERKAFDYIESRLRTFGVAYQRFEPEIYISVPKSASLRITSPKDTEMKVKSVSFSGSTAPGKIESEVVYVGGAQATGLNDFFNSNIGNADVEGKISLCEGFGLPSKIDALEKAGAIAQIYINPGQRIHDGMASPIWGSPGLSNLDQLPKTPIISINNPDGKKFVEFCRQGSVTVELQTDLDEGWKRLPLIEVTIKGNEKPEEFVLVHGHVDSWGVGIGDNAVGDATLLELARLFHQHRNGLKRTLKIAWWPGHSTGRYAGSAWYVDTFAQQLDQHCVAQVNIDSPGCRGATSYEDVLAMPEAEAFCTQAIQDAMDQTPTFMRPLRAGDYSFNNVGISSFYMLLSTIPAAEKQRKDLYPVGGCGGNIEWHTEADTMEVADLKILLNDLRVYLTSLRRVLNSEIYPFDYRITLKRMEQALKGYELDTQKAKVSTDFSAAKTEMTLLYEAVNRMYNTLDSGQITSERANNILRRLARHLVTLDNTTSPRFFHDPALPRPSLPAIAVAQKLGGLNDREKKFAEVDLRQGLNHIAGSLRQTRETVEIYMG